MLELIRGWRSGLVPSELDATGISFAGKLDAKFGPFFASACRIDDIRDIERLNIRDAMEHSSRSQGLSRPG
jgi:hypothetical protein